VQLLFQELTGMGKAIETRKLWHAPFTMYQNLDKMILREMHHAKQGKKAHVIIKVNALTDTAITNVLYKASQAGVKIDLIVRSMCVLIPGLKGISENITVKSTVGRFLEHSRVYYFHDDGNEKIYCSSADLMERNLYHRLETCFPILDKELAKRIKHECLEVQLQDNCQSWQLASDGQYTQNTPGTKSAFSAQEYLLSLYADH
ncbi:MAG: phospholipase D-like domain-containing protein, partial [Gammaproteobacteria bacterium]